MGSSDDQQQAIRLLRIHRRNLGRLEEQKARLAGAMNLAIENAIDEEKANIAALEPIANPPTKPSPTIQDFVVQASDGNWAMMFSQFVLLNARMTRAEEQNQEIIQEQSRASIDRMQTKEVIDALVVQAGATERARIHGAKWYRRALLIALGMAVLALMVGCAALAAVWR